MNIKGNLIHLLLGNHGKVAFGVFREGKKVGIGFCNIKTRKNIYGRFFDYKDAKLIAEAINKAVSDAELLDT
jgi:hypothetical protein